MPDKDAESATEDHVTSSCRPRSLKKQRVLDHEVSQKRRRMTQGFSFGLMWRDLTHKIRYSLLEGSSGCCCS